MAPQTPRAVDARAAEWLARLQSEGVSPDERAEFERWLGSEPAHAVAFSRVEHAWERAERLRAVPRDVARSVMWRHAGKWAKAAMVAAVIIGGVAAHLAHRQASYATAVGERQTLSIADGSKIHLNTASRVEVDLNERQRTIRLLSGEALFEVARDPARPFVVEVAGTRVRVLGTAFNVRVRDQFVEVAVTEGLVAVGDVQIAAGSSVIVAPGSLEQVSRDDEGVRRRVSWRYGVIELKGETLAQAVEEFNRYRTRKLVIADPEIAGVRVGGRFQTDEAGKFLSALEAGFDVRAVESEDGRTYLFGEP
jgi:transmembrane sensor